MKSLLKVNYKVKEQLKNDFSNFSEIFDTELEKFLKIQIFQIILIACIILFWQT